MHFNFTVNVGDIIGTLILGGMIHIVWYLRRFERLVMQHELMWQDFTMRRGFVRDPHAGETP